MQMIQNTTGGTDNLEVCLHYVNYFGVKCFNVTVLRNTFACNGIIHRGKYGQEEGYNFHTFSLIE